MKKRDYDRSPVAAQIECFGDFSLNDPICKKYCALSLRCIIERDQNTPWEVWEDLVSTEDLFLKIQ
ncbi:MAG: hypothetical protein JSW39_26410 [Desulfobacterales bacterium]|nr:MAG: hypothetical protein JSW39_26410 [Desulfobacterales bacterium]